MRIPAEWEPQSAMWTAWPADPGEWNGDLDAPRRDIAGLVEALHSVVPVKLLVHGAEAQSSARRQTSGTAELVEIPYGDIWLRDTGPIFAKSREGARLALRFKTNAWGGKFDLPDDATVGDGIAQSAAASITRHDFVLEGGAIDHDGNGTFLTTRQTLLNPNRNGWTKDEAEAALRDALGARKVIWIDEGLSGDHTDGHIDNLARFVAPHHVVCQSSAGDDDPNAATFEAIYETLKEETDADGRPIKVTRVPGPGKYVNDAGEIAPASHMNFIISNGVVVVPTFGTSSQQAALGVLSSVFPNHTVSGLPARGLLGSGDAGGGAFHCITQQEPAS